MALTRLAAARQLQKCACVGQMMKTSVMTPTSTVVRVIREINTTEKKGDSHGAVAPHTLIPNPPRTAEDFIQDAKTPRSWISFGFDKENEETDRQNHFSAFFVGISLMTVVGSFIIAYIPDFKNQDWAYREAYLELARREKLGLPKIDKELIPVERIVLPTEDELVGVKVFL